MSYENRFNDLILNVVNKNGDPMYKFEMSINYTNAESMATPDVDVRFITKPTNEFEDTLQDELMEFAQHAKNREKFLTEKELIVVFDHINLPIRFQEDNSESAKVEQRFDEYCDNGTNCPFCESTLIEGLEVEFEGVQCIRNVRCKSCAKEWTDVYRLVSIKNI